MTTRFGIFPDGFYHVTASTRLSEAILKSVHTDEYEAFLQRLAVARREAGLTQQGLANRIGRPQSFVSKYERGERRLDVLEFVTVCHVLSVDPCSIIREVESQLLGEVHSEDEAW